MSANADAGERPAREDARGGRALVLRILSAMVLIPLALAVAWAGGAVLAAWVGALALGLVYEWRGLVRHAVGWPETVLLAVGALGVVGLAALGRTDGSLLTLTGAGTAAGLLGSLRGRDGFYALFGAFYLLAPALAFLWLRAGEDGFFWVLWLFSVVWTTDTGAYIAGRMIGGPAFAPYSSPNKTWAGLLGGIAFALAAGTTVAWFLFEPGSSRALIWFMTLGLLISVVTQAGDIFESGLKRHFRVKDTGRLIPGHGGLLDRLDGFLFAAMMLSLALAFR